MKQEETRMDVRLRMGVSRRARGFAQSDQILSLTWAYFRIAPPQYSSHAFFPFVPKAGFELVFYSMPLFSAGHREDSSAALPKSRTE